MSPEDCNDEKIFKIEQLEAELYRAYDDSRAMLVFDYLCHGLESVLQTFYLK